MGSDPVNYAEIARRVVADGLATSMSKERVRQRHETDPAFPPDVGRLGRSLSFEWAAVRKYFSKRDPRPGKKGWAKSGRGQVPACCSTGVSGLSAARDLAMRACAAIV